MAFPFKADEKLVDDTASSNTYIESCLQESSVESSQWRNIKQHVLPYGSSRPLTRKLSFDASSSESRGTEASTSMSTENTSVSINVPKLAEVSKICSALLLNMLL